MEPTDNLCMVSEELEEAVRVVFHRPFSFEWLRRYQLYIRSVVISKKKKLIDIGLRRKFSGYWKLFMDGNLWTLDLFRSLIPVNQLTTKVYGSGKPS